MNLIQFKPRTWFSLTLGRPSYLLQQTNPTNLRGGYSDLPPPKKISKQLQIKDQALAWR